MISIIYILIIYIDPIYTYIYANTNILYYFLDTNLAK